MSEQEEILRTKDTIDVRTRVGILENQVSTIVHSIEKLETKVDDQYQMIHSRISDMRDDLREDIDESHDRIMAKMEAHAKSEAGAMKELRTMLAGLEKWRWMIMGAAVVAGYILAHLKLEKFF